MKKHTGYIIGHGRSLIDGAPIVVIATVKSRNIKTGNMVQTWILRTDMNPIDAAQSGADVAICGGCKHRPSLGGACYVDLSRAPSQVFKAFLRGAYPDISDNPAAIAALGAGRAVRLGAYGDPMAVPASIWECLTSQSSGHSGYSHQWMTGAEFADQDQISRIMRLCMASADDAGEKAIAKSAGHRTFRVRLADEPLEHREIACPASDEAGNRTTYERCTACNGAARQKAADVAIIVHGAKSKRFVSLRLAA
jgi:hypothetical protein